MQVELVLVLQVQMPVKVVVILEHLALDSFNESTPQDARIRKESCHSGSGERTQKPHLRLPDFAGCLCRS